MNGYKILIIEDDLGRNIDSYYPLFFDDERTDELSEDLEADLDSMSLLTALDKEKSLRALGFVDVAESTREALEILDKNAGQYLLMLVDRDLSEKGTLGESFWFEIKKYWPEYKGAQCEQSGFYGGDLLLEFLCLKKGMVDECRNRFRFITHNARQHLKELQSFLTQLHFPDDLIGSSENPGRMIVSKGSDTKSPDSENYLKLKKQVVKQPALHIWRKYQDVFSAFECFDEEEISKEEHIQNLIEALAFVEGVKLNWQDLKRPSISMLRQLIEAIRSALKKEVGNKGSKASEFFKCAFLHLKKMNNRYDPQRGDIGHWFLPTSYLGYHNRKGACDGCKEIHQVATKKRNGISDELYQFELNYSHYAAVDRMVYAIASQEMHHSDTWSNCEGARPHLLVYGICELLRFYKRELKGA